MPDICARNREDTNSSGDEVEGNFTRSHVAMKKTVFLKDAVTRLDDKHHKVIGLNDQNH